MKGLVLLVTGIGIGFIAAHQVSKTPQGRQFFDEFDTRTREFSGALVDGYKQREAERREAVADAKDAY